jgi:hypothetical protein
MRKPRSGRQPWAWWTSKDVSNATVIGCQYKARDRSRQMSNCLPSFIIHPYASSNLHSHLPLHGRERCHSETSKSGQRQLFSYLSPQLLILPQRTISFSSGDSYKERTCEILTLVRSGTHLWRGLLLLVTKKHSSFFSPLATTMKNSAE